MLVTSKRQASKYENTNQICTSDNGEYEVFCADGEEDCPPACRVKNPVKLLTADDWLRVTKKFRLSNSSIRKLKKFWAMGETDFTTDSPRTQWAFQELESIMLRKMKRFHKAKPGVKYLPFHDASQNNDHVTS
jgi:hypothetical protein